MKKIISASLVFLMLLAGCSNSSQPKEEKKKAQKEVKDTVVSFMGVGDNLIHETIYQQADRASGEFGDGKYDFTEMYANMKKDIKAADIAFINQETILGGDARGISGYPIFNTPDVMADNLETLGFDLVNTATNHCLDEGMAGIENSSRIWKSKKDMVMAGTYTSQEDRDTIRIIERDGIKFAFLAYTYGTNGIDLPYEYSVAMMDSDKIRGDVAKAKEISDVIIVSAHWGDENVLEASDYQKEYAQLFADLDVDVVIGTHPHVIEPMEWVKGKDGNQTLVVYSLGNFLGGMLNVNNVLSGKISFDFVKNAKTKEITIENVLWTPLVIHYNGDANNIEPTRDGYKIYHLAEYTDELAAQHGLNGYEGQSVTVEGFWRTTQQVIDSQFLNEGKDK